MNYPIAKRFKASGNISSWSLNIIGRPLDEIVTYLSEFANVEYFPLGDKWYVNATSLHGIIHVSF